MSDKLQLDLDVVLPHAHDAHDRCVADLVGALERLDGIDSVHVVDDRSPLDELNRSDPPLGGSPATVCLHLAPGAVSIKRLTERVRAVGASIDEQYGHVVVRAAGVGNTSRAAALSKQLRALPGVVDGAVTVDGMVRVEYDRGVLTETSVAGELRGLGLYVDRRRRERGEDDHDHHDENDSDNDSGRPGPQGSGHESGHDHGHAHGGNRTELAAALFSLAVYLVARGLDWFSDVEGPVTTLYVVAAVVTGVFVARDAWLSVRARIFDIDQLMLIAAVGAAIIGHWSDSALLLVLFSLGHALEGYAMNRARNAIEALGKLAPATARRKDDSAIEVAVIDLELGDIVVVRPNERIPADGVIVAGETSIDESPVTGESVPVDKSAIDDPSDALSGIESIPTVHRTFAGTLNGPGAIEVMVLRVAADTTLSRVVQLVAEAETQISPTQRLTKRIVRVFVPAVLILVAALLIVPPLLGEAFSESFARAMAVLVAASPCALAIATPSAVLAAIARAARSGILVKGGGPLEALGAVENVAFDKTGTLTEGRPTLTDVVPVDPSLEPALLAVTLAVERLSDHPIARAITIGLASRLGAGPVPEAVDVVAVNGKGITAMVDGESVEIGNRALFDGTDWPDAVASAQERLEAEGRTTMAVRRGQQFLGVLGVMDTPRDDAGAVIEALRELGVANVVMLSGDNQRVATAVAGHIGIAPHEAQGGLLPTDKVDAVNRLAQSGGVAMVGDGVNDAPALAAANVGIAMGAAGSDVALETADIALLADRLSGLPTAVSLARRASRTIKQNLFFSLGIVAVLIPMTIAGVGISIAVIAHEGSTLVVVANALRLLNHRES